MCRAYESQAVVERNDGHLGWKMFSKYETEGYKNTIQIDELHTFVNEWNFYKRESIVVLRIDIRT